MTQTLSVDRIRALLDDPSRRRPPAAEGLHGVLVVVDGKPAIVYSSTRPDEQLATPSADEQVRLARRQHAAHQAGLLTGATAAEEVILREYYYGRQR